MKRASGSTASRSPGKQKKRQRNSNPSGAPCELLDDLRESAEREEVRERTIGAIHGELQHLAAERGKDDGDRVLGGRLQLEAGGCAFALECGAQEVECVAHPGQRVLEGDLIPAFDDSVRGGADAEYEASVRGIRERGGLLRQQSRAALEDADDAGAESDLVGPGGGEDERGETVRPVGLAAPEVGVPGGLGLEDEIAVVRERKARERQGESPALSHRLARA